ncbi:hypothetical protein SDC9_73177 [bioreactor metagenome]|uniref:Uncharacterized protein n=1 Tax=bioreactor metagenome TaxID=1076179 RepID=A0A644YJK0_9ZZZZ
MNKNVTAAASQYSPMNIAPTTATVTSASMPSTLYLRDTTAFLAVWYPAVIAAAIINASLA